MKSRILKNGYNPVCQIVTMRCAAIFPAFSSERQSPDEKENTSPASTHSHLIYMQQAFRLAL